MSDLLLKNARLVLADEVVKGAVLVRDGVIAGTDLANKTLFISTPTFPGNSGGPIFVVRSPSNAAGGMAAGQQTTFLAGIVTHVDTVQPSNDPKAAPLRIGVGVAIDVVFGLLKGTEAVAMAEAVKASRPTTG